MNEIIPTDSTIPPEHAEAFGRFYLARSALRVRLGALAGVFIFAMATLADLRVLPPEVLAWSAPLRLGLVCPLLLLLAWISANPARHRWHLPVALSVVGMGATVVSAIVIHLQVLEAPWDMQRVCLATFWIYVVSGLRARVAIGLGTFVYVGIIAAEYATGNASTQVVRSLVSLTAANLLGATAALALEQSMRASFMGRLRLTQVAERDGLTGIFNRRHLDEHLERVHKQAQRDGRNLAVAMIDIDEFKRFNDSQGHQAGDECLRKVARALGRCAHRPLDLVARYGGEEFCIVWYAPEIDAIPALLEQCREAVANLEVPHDASSVEPCVTVSCGAAVGPARTWRSEELIAAADHALYEAKYQGRNRSIVA